MIPFAQGKQVKLPDFMVPRAPVLRPLPNPVEEEVQPPLCLPPAAMDLDDVYCSWPQNDIELFHLNHQEVSLRVPLTRDSGAIILNKFHDKSSARESCRQHFLLAVSRVTGSTC